jgi:hypothetical protein
MKKNRDSTGRRRTVPTTKTRASRRQLANHEVVVLAAYLAGAQSAVADTEDIAVKANQLAPGRFNWRKYQDQINIDTVRKRLWDAAKPDKGAYLIGSEKNGWRLTKAGFEFARRKMKSGAAKRLARQRASRNESALQNREIRRMVHEDAFVKFTKGLNGDITRFDAERFFRIDDYVTGRVRTAKIERFRIMAIGNERLSRAIDFLANLVKEG